MEGVAAPKLSSNIQKTLATAVEAAWSRAVASAEAAGISRQASQKRKHQVLSGLHLPQWS
jgi:hypothetical protein